MRDQATPNDPVSSSGESDPSDPAEVDVREENERRWTEVQGYSPLNDGAVDFMLLPQEEENDDSEALAYDQNAHPALDEEQSSTEGDYRIVAEQALRALELDYQQTIEAGQLVQDGEQEEDSSFKISDTMLRSQEPFVANFGHSTVEAPETTKPSQVSSSLPHIDLDAVKRIVLKLPNNQKIQENYHLWHASHTSAAPSTHPLIPRKPLLAFRRETEKAKQASRNLSRSATIAEALDRLGLLREQECLSIHILACDRVECSSTDTTHKLLAPLVRWISAAPRIPCLVKIALIGPNVPLAVVEESISLMPPHLPRPGLQEATACYRQGVYEETINDDEDDPSLIIAFNAGLWGYREWVQTVQFMARRRREIPFVSTAYTLPECEDDLECIKDALEEVQSDAPLLWEPEINPFASRVERKTSSAAPGRIYHENGAWLAWRL